MAEATYQSNINQGLIYESHIKMRIISEYVYNVHNCIAIKLILRIFQTLKCLLTGDKITYTKQKLLTNNCTSTVYVPNLHAVEIFSLT
jgi:hypothetical protein